MSQNSSPSQRVSDSRSKSCDTACSSNSSCFFQRRSKAINPLASSLRNNNYSRNTINAVRQRVLSAKILKLKSVQNQLNDANFHLAEVVRENQALKNLQKRQDKALSRYEGTQAELPKLIQSHEEEIRFLTEKNKNLRKTAKELNEQVKHKNDELACVQEQLKHYEKLDKDKHLLEREKLLEELDDLKGKLVKADNSIVTLNRKLTLENKTAKHRLNVEISKHKQCQKELSQALMEINRITKLLDPNEKRRFGGFKSQSTSLIGLASTESAPVTDIKLEPITQLKKDDSQVQTLKPYKGILKCPSEIIKARLSADSKKDDEDISLDKMSITGSDSSNDKDYRVSRPNSSVKLEKIELELHNNIKKVEDSNHNDDVNKHLSNYCLQAIDSVKTYNTLIDNHRENITEAKSDTDKILGTLQKTEELEKKIAVNQLDNLDFVTKILKEEEEFQKKHMSNNKETTVRTTDKKKLLAALRAIDNGDSVESYDSGIRKIDDFFEDIVG